METLTEVVRSSKQIKIQGFSVTSAMSDGEVLKSRWKVGGYDWEVQLFPKSVVLHLYLRSQVSPHSSVMVMFSARLVDQVGIGKLTHRGILPVPYKFKRSGDCCYGGVLMRRSELEASGYLKDDAFVAECTLAVLKELDKNATTHHRPADDLVPSSGLNHATTSASSCTRGRDPT